MENIKPFNFEIEAMSLAFACLFLRTENAYGIHGKSLRS